MTRLQSEQELFRSLTEAAMVPAAIYTGQAAVVAMANAAMLALWGEDSSVTGKAVPETALQAGTSIQAIKEVLQGGAPRREPELMAEALSETRHSPLYFSHSYQPLKNKTGEVIAVIHTAMEVTELVRAKQKIAETEEHLSYALRSAGTGNWDLDLIHQHTGHTFPVWPDKPGTKTLDYKSAQLHIAIKELEFLANSVPVVVWTSRPDGKLEYINQRWYERSDIPIDQALGSGWAEILHPEDEKRAWAAWRDCLRTGNPFQIEFRLLDKNGEYRWWMVRAIALKDEQGQILKWYGSNIDITDQKELEHQKDNFLGVASHELKTPVTSIKAYAQVLEMMFRRAGDIKHAELLKKMDNQINRLSKLIGDLLEVTKINSGRLQFNPVEFSFNELVLEVIEEVQRTTLTHRIAHELGFTGMVRGDKERISQVIVNLLTNAIKYSPAADHILISTADHGHEMQLCVQDFGIGIKNDQQNRVFEQFYRVSGTREHTFPGLGLGLYISSEIVKHLNGRIWVNSVQGKGSTFCFSLPLNNSSDHE